MEAELFRNAEKKPEAKEPPAKAVILAEHKLYKMEPGNEKEYVGVLQKEKDGRLSWLGTVQPGALSGGSPQYVLLAVYSHNHPSNDTYGGSVKVYVVAPDLEELAGSHGIPHTLRDGAGQLYLCTARKEDIRTGRVNTSAASSIGMAVKWLASFEMWVDGAISVEQFQGHNI